MSSRNPLLACADNRPRFSFTVHPDPADSSRKRFVVLRHDAPRWFLTNRTGLEVFDILRKGGTAQAAEQYLCDRYGVASTVATRDVLAVLNQMRKFAQAAPAGPRTRRLRGLFLHLTRRCNLQCSHCYASAGKSSDHIPLELALRLIDQLSAVGGEAVALSGGEPLCYPSIEQLIRHACARLPKVKLLTNGTLVNRAFVEQVACDNLEIHVSIDGAAAGQHDQLRGSGAFKRTMRGISAWTEVMGPERLSLSATVTKANVATLHGLVGLARGLGVSRLRFLPLRSVGRGEGLDGRPDFEAYISFIRRVQHEIAGDRSFTVTYGITGFLFEVPTRSTGEIWCPVGEQMVVDTNGDAYPCVLMMKPKFKCGNARENTLDGLLKTVQIQEVCGALFNRPSRLPECAVCPWRSLCQSGCMGQAEDDHGTIWSRDPFCEYRLGAYPEAFDRLLEDSVKQR